jgi:hypothetical protein
MGTRARDARVTTAPTGVRSQEQPSGANRLRPEEFSFNLSF